MAKAGKSRKAKKTTAVKDLKAKDARQVKGGSKYLEYKLKDVIITDVT